MDIQGIPCGASFLFQIPLDWWHVLSLSSSQKEIIKFFMCAPADPRIRARSRCYLVVDRTSQKPKSYCDVCDVDFFQTRKPSLIMPWAASLSNVSLAHISKRSQTKSINDVLNYKIRRSTPSSILPHTSFDDLAIPNKSLYNMMWTSLFALKITLDVPNGSALAVRKVLRRSHVTWNSIREGMSGTV